MEAAQLGTVALWAAVAASAAALFYRPRATLRLAAVFAALATVVLAVALLTHDFSREYVAKTTSRATPWPYRISAVWGGMEGSMLFYVAVLLGIGAWGVRKRGELEHRVVAAVGLAGLLAEPPTSDRLGAGAAHRGDVRSVLGIVERCEKEYFSEIVLWYMVSNPIEPEPDPYTPEHSSVLAACVDERKGFRLNSIPATGDEWYEVVGRLGIEGWIAFRECEGEVSRGEYP